MQVREELSFAITQPIAHPEQYAAMGLGAATGVLLYGPPGCGKTLVAKAIANESGVNFISIKVCLFPASPSVPGIQPHMKACCFLCIMLLLLFVHYVLPAMISMTANIGTVGFIRAAFTAARAARPFRVVYA